MENRRTFVKRSIGTGMGLAAGVTGTPFGLGSPKPQAMIVATTGPFAIRSGLASMQEGGSAADAVLTTALSQIALCAGCWVSYAGRMTAVYFDVQTGRLHALNACYDAPRHELDPLSIPRQPTPTGRNVLVPGFMAGVESLHRKFGKRRFANLFQPAIQLADEGFTLTRQMANLIRQKSQVLTRYEGGRQVFLNSKGTLFEEGEHFSQPALAQTLRQVAQHGAQAMYRGEWAEKFIRAVQSEGGRIAMDDLEQYSPTWTNPLSATLHDGSSVYGLPTPNRGGPIALACLNLASHARLDELGHYTNTVQSLEHMLKIETAAGILSWDRRRALLGEFLGRRDLTLNDFADEQLGAQLWKLSQSADWERLLDQLRAPQPQRSEHSDAVVAVDPFGNVAAILHTINTGGWGTTGLFVEGVSIPDSGASQQSAIAKAGPGGRIADHGPPLIAMQNGRPLLAGSATGSGNVHASWQNFIDVLLYGMTPQEAADSANFYNHTFEDASLKANFVQRARSAGVPVKLKPRFSGNELGFWAGIGINAANGDLQAGKIRKLDGIAASY